MGGTAGIPLQFTTDCGSETTQLYRLVNALRFVIFVIYIYIVEADSAYKRDHLP